MKVYINLITICSFYISVIINWSRFNSIFFKSSILFQIALYFSNSFSYSIRKDIYLLFLSLSPSLTLNMLRYPPILGIIKTNALAVLLIFIPILYLELVFVLTSFKIIILSTLTISSLKLSF